jgi:hypothetical protein
VLRLTSNSSIEYAGFLVATIVIGVANCRLLKRLEK